MKTNLRERLTRYQCFIRPKFSFKSCISITCVWFVYCKQINWKSVNLDYNSIYTFVCVYDDDNNDVTFEY